MAIWVTSVRMRREDRSSISFSSSRRPRQVISMTRVEITQPEAWLPRMLDHEPETARFEGRPVVEQPGLNRLKRQATPWPTRQVTTMAITGSRHVLPSSSNRWTQRYGQRLPKLPIEVRIVVGVHAAFEGFGIG